MKKAMLLCFAAMSSLTALSGTVTDRIASFVQAKPVWPEGRECRMNDFVEFRASFDMQTGEKAVLRVTGSSVYRICFNGKFAGYGPARAAKGFFRVDEWPLAANAGSNVLSIEVSAYNCNNFYIPDQPAFLLAEVVSGDGRVLAATTARTDDGKAPCRTFSAHETPRVAKCARYSYQRAFCEAYRLPQDCTQDAALVLSERPDVRLLERIAQYPMFDVIDGLEAVSATSVSWQEPKSFRKARWVDETASYFKCYNVEELEANHWRDLQCVKASRESGALDGVIQAGRGVQYDVGLNATGFVGAEVECLKAGVLWLAFDEILTDGVVDPLRFSVCNAVRYELKPGRYAVETFEPYTLKYLHVYTLDGEFRVMHPHVRTYRTPAADGVVFKSSDPAVNGIFAAARETFAQNAVDVFTDCPSRERAGWLCDSFFLGRVSALLTGSTDLERLFVHNYLLPDKFDDIPDGMLPMCYPSNHPRGRYIPNWAMWFVIELDEYLVRSGDRATVDAIKPRLVKLVDFLWKYRNSDGLLEKLPSWVFVEWSQANKLVQDVNYPSNMTWAEVLDAMNRLYGMPELAEEAERIRGTIRRQSWTGKWFCDNAVRQKDGSLKLSGECTETCQYYAFFFRTATPASHPELWRTLVEDFGPKRRDTKKHPGIWPSNAFIGNYLRLECLSREGLSAQILDEAKGYFSYMADATGTLWENISTAASCNHGFASHVAVSYCRDIVGVREIDRLGRKVRFSPPEDVPINSISMDIPVGGGAFIHAGWRREGGRVVEELRLPDGWSRETAAKFTSPYGLCGRIDDVSETVRPGNAEKGVPFWNGYAAFFRYAPVFEFKTVPGAVQYRFTLKRADAAENSSFLAESPESPLSPVWKSLANGQWNVLCEGLDAKGGVVGVAGGRTFVKTAPFADCKCEGAARPYREAARMVYEYMTSLPAMKTLVETGVPDQDYQHNAYPSKTHAAHIKAMLEWAQFDQKNREKAMRFARASGDYLLSQLEPADAPLAFWPPTYGRQPLAYDPKANGGKNRPAMVGNDPEGAAKYRGQVMTLYPADVGVQFVALSKATGEKKYLDAAKGIGETYLKIRRADGTWALKYWLATGETECPNPLVPTKPMAFFESLADATGDAKWRKAADECFAWLEKGPLTDWNWDGQFEDIEPRPQYMDLTKHNAIDTMFHLLKRRSSDPAARKLAREILRWSEDQFVFWEAPCAPDAKVPRSGAKPGTFSPGKWHYPSVFEQYSCYISIDASAAKMILAYLALYRVEKNPLDLAKAKALADAMTQVQEPSGRIPTFWAAKDDWISDVRYDWLNCMAASAAALVETSNCIKNAQVGKPFAP